MTRICLCRRAAIAIATCLCCLVFKGRSQVKLGIGAGGTASNFNFQPSDASGNYSNQIKPGFNGGIKVDIPMTTISKTCTFRLIPEIFIIQNGANGQYYYNSVNSLGNDAATNGISLNYIGLYLPAKLQLQLKGGTCGMYLLAGGFFDRVVSSSVNDGSSQASAVIFQSGSDKYDFGFRGGLGFIFPRKDNGPALALEFGFNKGLNNISFYTDSYLGSAGRPNTYVVNNNGITLAVVTTF